MIENREKKFIKKTDGLSRSEPTYQNSQLKNYNLSNPSTLILLKIQNGKNALAYYQKGKLTMASFVSIGTPQHKTISGQYIITPDQIRRRSRRYKNAPMPYSLHISGGYFLHQGRSNGYPLSMVASECLDSINNGSINKLNRENKHKS